MIHNCERCEELNRYFGKTVSHLVTLIKHGVTVDSLILALVNLNTEAANNINNKKEISGVSDENIFRQKIFPYLNNVNRILTENEERINSLPSETKAQAEKAREEINKIEYIERELEKEIEALNIANEALQKKNNDLENTRKGFEKEKIASEKRIEEGSRLQNDILKHKAEIASLNAPETGEIESLKKKSDDLQIELGKLTSTRDEYNTLCGDLSNTILQTDAEKNQIEENIIKTIEERREEIKKIFDAKSKTNLDDITKEINDYIRQFKELSERLQEAQEHCNNLKLHLGENSNIIINMGKLGISSLVAGEKPNIDDYISDSHQLENIINEKLKEFDRKIKDIIVLQEEINNKIH